jgi:hypothetical protein
VLEGEELLLLVDGVYVELRLVVVDVDLDVEFVDGVLVTEDVLLEVVELGVELLLTVLPLIVELDVLLLLVVVLYFDVELLRPEVVEALVRRLVFTAVP